MLASNSRLTSPRKAKALTAGSTALRSWELCELWYDGIAFAGLGSCSRSGPRMCGEEEEFCAGSREAVSCQSPSPLFFFLLFHRLLEDSIHPRDLPYHPLPISSRAWTSTRAGNPTVRYTAEVCIRQGNRTFMALDKRQLVSGVLRVRAFQGASFDHLCTWLSGFHQACML